MGTVHSDMWAPVVRLPLPLHPPLIVVICLFCPASSLPSSQTSLRRSQLLGLRQPPIRQIQGRQALLRQAAPRQADSRRAESRQAASGKVLTGASPRLSVVNVGGSPRVPVVKKGGQRLPTRLANHKVVVKAVRQPISKAISSRLPRPKLEALKQPSLPLTRLPARKPLVLQRGLHGIHGSHGTGTKQPRRHQHRVFSPTIGRGLPPTVRRQSNIAYLEASDIPGYETFHLHEVIPRSPEVLHYVTSPDAAEERLGKLHPEARSGLPSAQERLGLGLEDSKTKSLS